MEIKLTPNKLAIFFSALMVLLLSLHILGFVPVWLGMRKFPFGPVNFDVEQNLPSFFSTALLVCSSLLVGCIAKGERDIRKSLHWAGLMVVFLLLALDENTEIHERLTEPLRCSLNAGGVFYYAWIIPYILVVAVFVACYFRFFLQLPKDTQKLVVLAAALYVGGAIGMEMINGAWRESFGRTASFYVLTTIEELMEMSGAIVFIYAFANHIDKHLPGLSLRITSS
ncbi:MAG: hypothetical protein ABFR33_08245 [Verrucomicrobiota bacterium]